MISKDPTAWELGTWFLCLFMAFGGGMINWYSKVKQGHARAFNIMELVGEIVVSGFVGIGTFMFLAGSGFSEGICAAAAGVSGHMGTRVLFLAENLLEKHFSDLAAKIRKEGD